ncbi:MAG: HNH endonuclease [Lachnospiraceae bacterium]|nr:HNH endonuclease [Lachnospiraceae bacterium]
MQLPYSENLEIEYLSRIFDNTSECYKFFWFQAIVSKVLEGKQYITYEELIDEMIVDAWYMVVEYHLNLGPRDTLEGLVHYLHQISGLKSSEKKENIINYLKNCKDREVARRKRILTKNVPYRIQAPFMDKIKGKEWNVSESALISRINQERRLMYYFENLNGMQTTIRLNPEWFAYIHKNQEIIKGWLMYNIIIYLQKRNPSVPGIADKLYPPQERKLEKVKKYWKLLLTLQPVYEIYGHMPLSDKDISIDHFVPWSYVAHDEFWNLHPTTRSINSSKSNHLPDWKTYFPQLARLEYFSYEMIWKYDAVRDEFEKCAREHLNDDMVRRKIYREGQDFASFSNALEETVQPVYQSAKNCGFKDWIYMSGKDNNESDNILL